MSEIKDIERPVFYPLEDRSLEFKMVEWPIRRVVNGDYKIVDIVTIKNDSEYHSSDGTKIKVLAIFEGKGYPTIDYSIEGLRQEKKISTSLHWFANNIVYKNK